MMTFRYKLTYHPEVSTDVKNSKKWYKEQLVGLEKRFAADIRLTLERIGNNPLNYELRYRNVRIAYCQIFPYAIHFYLNEEQKYIVIIAVVHQYRNPSFAQNRK